MLLPESALLSCIFGRRRATSVVVAAAIDTLLCFTKPRLLKYLRGDRGERRESERTAEWLNRVVVGFGGKAPERRKGKGRAEGVG